MSAWVLKGELVQVLFFTGHLRSIGTKTNWINSRGTIEWNLNTFCARAKGAVRFKSVRELRELIILTINGANVDKYRSLGSTKVTTLMV